uniref:Methyltransferase type 11 domain-containing protein n=1 Tax=Oryza punctata TaxID=4537 RepID=A0A0E0LV07_ORYPU
MWSRSSASAAGSAVALCGARGVHRLLTCVASPARRRAAGKAKSIPRSALRASVTPDAVTAAPDEAIEESSVEQAAENKLSKLACPICYYPLVSSSDQSAKFGAASSLECSTCKKFYPNRGDYWDMTVAVGSTEYSESTTVTTEFEMAKTYLKPTTGGIIVDASCGSGLFSRLFVKSELYSHVVALDFSENMLKQCNEFVKQENISDKTLALVRADISRLPFVSGSIDAVHAAAAIHCWPSPACAVAEISRVLRPGGVFVASTFVADILPPAVPVLRIGRPYISQFTGSNIFLSEAEFEDLCRACGLVDFTILRALSSWTNSFT